LSPDQAPDRRPFDCRLALQLEAQFDEERLDGFEIVDNDEDVVHPFKRHILPSLASLLMPEPTEIDRHWAGLLASIVERVLNE
jgi:hypothetical protein